MSTPGGSHLSDEDRVRLTLVAHADPSGLVTQCTWTKLMDFATLHSQGDATAAVRALEARGVVRRLNNNTRSPHFQILTMTTEQTRAAHQYLAESLGRVNELRNSRSQSYAKSKQLRSNATGTSDELVIANLTLASQRLKTTKWSFDLDIAGYAVVRNCVYIESPDHREPYVGGPRLNTKDGWIPVIIFEKTFTERLRAKVAIAIAQATATMALEQNTLQKPVRPASNVSASVAS